MLFLITVITWSAAEVVLQLRGYLKGGRAKTTEWGSLGFIVLFALVGGRLAGLIAQHTHDLDLPIHGPAWDIPLCLIIWFGIGFRLWSIYSLGRYFRGVVHIQEGHEVVRSGPYRVLRHPSYTGLLLTLLGFSLTFANLGAIVVYDACLLAAVLYRIRVEERVLLNGLGGEYAGYMTETHRLVPGVW